MSAVAGKAPEPPEIQRADPVAQRRELVLVAVALAAGLGLLATLATARPELERWLTANAELLAARPGLVAAAALVLVLPLCAFALYLWRLGGRVSASGRFPPPDTPVLRDTRVLEGAPARRRGRVIRALAALLLATSLAVPATLWYAFWLLGRSFAGAS